MVKTSQECLFVRAAGRDGAMTANDNRKTGSPETDPIALALQRLHQSVATEPLPASFLDLLDKIDGKGDGAKSRQAPSDGAAP